MTMRIMVVEDEALVRLDLVDLLEELGHLVIAQAPDGIAALELAHQHRPELAVVDIRLANNTDGGALARRLHEQLGISTLFVSGSITETFRLAMANINPRGFIRKPVSREALQDALGRQDTGP